MKYNIDNKKVLITGASGGIGKSLCEKFIETKEKLAIKIKDIVEKEKAGFAFPSQSVYVENIPTTKPDIYEPPKK